MKILPLCNVMQSSSLWNIQTSSRKNCNKTKLQGFFQTFFVAM